jgi:hypothetical protein
MEGYTQEIRFDPRKMFNGNEPIPIPELPDEIALSLTGIELYPDGRVRYQYPRKNQVRDSLAKLLGLTNGNKDVVAAILEAVGMITVNVQNNQYNLTASEKLRGAITDR